MTNYPDLFAALAAPFDPLEVKTREKRMAYVTARTVMNRLDSVLGPENWWARYKVLSGADSVLCRLTIRLPDGSTVSKEDAGGAAGMSDAGDDDKSAVSDALKRAAVTFGVARYLYRDGVPSYATATATPAPATLGWVHEERPAPTTRPSRPEAPYGTDRRGRPWKLPPPNDLPTNGRQLCAWAKKQEEHGHRGLLQRIAVWGNKHGYPVRVVDWDLNQVDAALEEWRRTILENEPAELEAVAP